MADGIIHKADMFGNSVLDLNQGDGTTTAGTASVVRLVWNVLTYTTGTIQVVCDSALSTAVLTIQRSNDGVTFFDLETPKTVTSAPSISAAIDVSGFAYLALAVTTSKAATGKARVVACFKKTNS